MNYKREVINLIIIIVSIPFITFSGENKRLTKIEDIASDEKKGYMHGVRIYDKKCLKIFSYDELKKRLKDIDYVLPANYSKKSRCTGISVKIASSSCLREGKTIHMASNAFDNNLKTSWAEGVNGFGFKEWIKFDFRSKKEFGFVYVIVFPGFGKSEKLFKENNRVKSLVLKAYTPSPGSISVDNIKFEGFMSGSRLNFKDEYKYHVYLIQGRFLGGNNVQYTFYIEDVYKGSKYNDTCIAEIIFADGLDIPIFRP